jgi:hypothetical protein
MGTAPLPRPTISPPAGTAIGSAPGPGGGPVRPAIDEGAAISVRDLRKAYGDHEAVRGVSFDVTAAEAHTARHPLVDGAI